MAAVQFIVNENEADFLSIYRGGIGVTPLKHLALGVSAFNIDAGSSKGNYSAAEVYGRLLQSVGDRAKLYLEGGMTTFNRKWSGGAGLLYSISRYFDLDVGYRYYAGVEDELEDNYSFGVGLQYNFKEHERFVKDEPVIVQRSEYVSEPEPIIESELVTELYTFDNCYNRGNSIVIYQVKLDDWLYKISRKTCNSINDIKKLNSFLVERERLTYLIQPGDIIRLYK